MLTNIFNSLFINGFLHTRIGLLIIYFKKSQQLSNHVFLSLKIFIILANHADPDEMLQFAAFHLVLHG